MQFYQSNHSIAETEPFDELNDLVKPIISLVDDDCQSMVPSSSTNSTLSNKSDSICYYIKQNIQQMMFNQQQHSNDEYEIQKKIDRTKLFIGNLPTNTRLCELLAVFRKYGRINEKLSVVKDQNYAFIHFYNEGDAKRALVDLNDSLFKDRYIRVQYSTSTAHIKKSKSLLSYFIIYLLRHFIKDCFHLSFQFIKIVIDSKPTAKSKYIHQQCIIINSAITINSIISSAIYKASNIWLK